MRTGPSFRTRLLGGAALAAAISCAQPAFAQAETIDIAPQPLTTALYQLGVQTGQQIIFSPSLAAAKMSQGTRSADNIELALNQLLEGTGLTYERTADAILIKKAAADPQSGSAAGDGADGTVDTLIVTAQKREEDIQDVPIAISAFTQEALETHQIAGGPDLITQVPNMTFTKTNFSSYSIQLRGIGTQAISATTDPGVAVAFNNTPFIQNRFFEQEFYDLARVEVLRGPQGTLYGRNATAGVVNIISQKPKFTAEAKLSADVANYNSTRVEGMVNVPLVEDKVALRLAGAWTKREGYATNELTGNPIDGRNLWSTRLSLRFTPNDKIDANLIWEHFEEDDDRLRSGKQLCKKHVVTQVGDIATPDFNQRLVIGGGQGADYIAVQPRFSQGCIRNSLYSPDSFQTPNGASVPYYVPLGAIGLPTTFFDPYASQVQSPDLRVIESSIEPEYRAKADIGELQVSWDITDHLTFSSETGYASDFVYSLQDFNRFNTVEGAWNTTSNGGQVAIAAGRLNSDGEFCDPQLGCSSRLIAVDIATAEGRQFNQEFRIASDFDGPFNFSLGANFTRFDLMAKYYVFINSLGLAATGNNTNSIYGPDNLYVPGVSDNSECQTTGMIQGDPEEAYGYLCVYIEPNPISNIQDQGHNYFLSKNPYKLISYAVFGEAYYEITENLRLTAGLRWTVDKKEAPRIPSWTLVGGTVGYPVQEVIEQEWREPTGRLALDWKPDLTFTDETLLYASYAHGYKAGGANPPPLVNPLSPESFASGPGGGGGPVLRDFASATRPKTFEAEYVNAFELGAKNTLADGRVVLNMAAFYYDYTGYQISEIVDRSAFNQNYDAEVWGLEIEADWRVFENLKLGFKGGYENTRIADHERAVDLMDRTAGNPDWVIIRPFPTNPSSCILPVALFTHQGNLPQAPGEDPIVLSGLNPGNAIFDVGGGGGASDGGCERAYVLGRDPITNFLYTPDPVGAVTNWADSTYPGWNPDWAPNNGEGFDKPLGGNQLPNAPNYTATLTVDYTLPLPNEWLMTLHTDLYWQSESWWRIFNDHEYDKLDEYFTTNLAAIFTNEDAGWKVMAYVKNVFDRDSITGAFLNSDDTGLTTNVFLTEPRLFGLRATKEFQGGAWWPGLGSDHAGPYPLSVELSGMVQRQEAEYETVTPSFIDSFSSGLNSLDEAQNRDLDRGDGREVRVTWRPGAGPWAISGGLRYGRTNSDVTRIHRDEQGPGACGFPDWHPSAPYCAPEFRDDPFYAGIYLYPTNFSDSTIRTRERHEIAEFRVGRDVGLGLGDRMSSNIGVDLRYAKLTSATDVEMRGIPNLEFTDGWIIDHFIEDSNKYPTSFTRYQAELTVEREFEGAGPMLSWEGAAALLGNRREGQVSLDWDLSGGALFGKQKTSTSGVEATGAFEGRLSPIQLYAGIAQFRADMEPETISEPPRSESVTVPVVDLSLGLSYEVQRVKIGAGYRWERYFDAIDGGFEEHRSFDRTIDGPYFKLSVGFGG